MVAGKCGVFQGACSLLTANVILPVHMHAPQRKSLLIVLLPLAILMAALFAFPLPTARATDLIQVKVDELTSRVNSRICPRDLSTVQHIYYKEYCGEDYNTTMGQLEIMQCQTHVDGINEQIAAYNSFVSECKKNNGGEHNSASSTTGGAAGGGAEGGAADHNPPDLKQAPPLTDAQRGERAKLIAKYCKPEFKTCRAPCAGWKNDKDDKLGYADCNLACDHNDASCAAAKRGEENVAEKEVVLARAFIAKLNKSNAELAEQNAAREAKDEGISLQAWKLLHRSRKGAVESIVQAPQTQPAVGGIDAVLAQYDPARRQKIITCVINQHGCCACEGPNPCNHNVYRECSSPSGLSSAIQFCTDACGL